jgi:hypothetical protein
MSGRKATSMNTVLSFLPKRRRLVRRVCPAVAGLILCFGLACGGSTSGIKPVGSPDPQTPCLASRIHWNLEIHDQRAEPKDWPRLLELLRESLSKSLPGCRWGSSERDAGTLVIEVHRFSAISDGAVWDAAAEWQVWVRDKAGQTLADFEATGEGSRPNYRGENSERVVLQQVLEQAMVKTLAGLRGLSTPS